MSSGAGTPGSLVFDPTRAAVANATLAEGTGTGGAGVGDDTGGAGGGIISANGTYYSKITTLAPSQNSDVADLIVVNGALLAGTLTAQVSNGSDDLDRNGTAAWVDYSTAQAVAGTANFAIELPRIGFLRMRMKFVVTAGTGTIEDRRAVKGS